MDSKSIATEILMVAKSIVGYNYPVYHKSYTSAVQAARDMVEKRGFEVDEDDWFNYVTTGPGRPREGETTDHKIGLLKNGKPVRKMLVFQVYGMPRSYELNAYIS
jgi:hypothetical protein